MKLLFDANLAPALVRILADCFPGSDHVYHHGLEASDQRIWEFALKHDFVIVTQDDDFVGMSLVSGPPPKVVLLRIGNCQTATVASLLRSEEQTIEAFGSAPEEGLLVLKLN